MPYWPERVEYFTAESGSWAPAPDGAERSEASPATVPVACWRSPLSVEGAEAAEALGARLAASVPPAGGTGGAPDTLAQCRASKAVFAVAAPGNCPTGRICVRAAARHAPPQGATTVARRQELGYELLNAVPWAHFEALNGSLHYSGSMADSAPFYLSSPRHCERLGGEQREWQSTHGFGSPWPGGGGLIPAQAPRFPIAGWSMPPFRAVFCGWGLLPPAFSARGYVVVANKKNTLEWGQAPVNFSADAELASIFDAVADAGLGLVYNRATPSLFASERAGFAGEDESDFAALRGRAEARFGPRAAELGAAEQRLLLLPELIAALAGAAAAGAAAASEAAASAEAAAVRYYFSPNAVQLAVLADARGYVAVQGGPSYLSLLWGAGRRVLLLQRKGNEVTADAARWFPRLSGMGVESVADGAALLDLVRRERWAEA